ncbi:MAG: CPBP family intramembrane glutamic endopeptidase [Chloroflexota bacterium]|jgi:membrane protease YdiL (CAAX protease family)
MNLPFISNVPDPLRVLIALGFTMLLVLLRLDAERFGVAEYDEPDRTGRQRSLRRRLGWYVVGIAGIVAVAIVHPKPDTDLYLGLGDRGKAIAGGLLYGFGGTAAAIFYAMLRYRHLRLPETWSYPGALINDVGTAFVDEAIFRGLVLGFLVNVGLQPVLAILIQALVYTLTTRVAARDRPLYMLPLTLAIGLVSGWLTVLTGGIGAAFLGHAVTRFSFFLTTGHRGHTAPKGREVEEMERQHRPPEGWRLVGPRESTSNDR